MAQPDGVVRFIRSAAGAGVPDAELVERFAANRDESAFRALIARYGPTVWAVCRKVSRDHHAAEDAFQAAFLVFARKANGLRAGAAVGSWLYAVAYRVAARTRAARRVGPVDQEPADRRPDALHELSAREAEGVLHAELAALPERYRAPLVLCCLEGLSRDEAAARLGWPANRVKHGLERGRELLRSRLTRRGLALGFPLILNALGQTASADPAPRAVETLIGYALGATPPAAVASLVNEMARTMWTAKWKWLAVGCGALVLAAGLLAALREGNRTAPPPETASRSQPVPVETPGVTEPGVPPAEKEEPPKQPWDVASRYLQLIIDGKPERALKLGHMLNDRHVQCVQKSGLTRVQFVAVLINDSRVAVVTERVRLAGSGNAAATDAHLVVELTSEDPDAPWRVNGCTTADEKEVLTKADEYLQGTVGGVRLGPAPKRDAGPKPSWDVAREFLTLACTSRAEEARKLIAPGTVSERKLGAIATNYFPNPFPSSGGLRMEMDGQPLNYANGPLGNTASSMEPIAVLLGDTRIETFFRYTVYRDGAIHGHLVLTLVKSRTGSWQVKDSDFRAKRDDLFSRFESYLEK